MFNEMMRAEIWLQESLTSQQTLEDLAIRLGYSTSQIRRRFRQCFGMSPSAYRESLRLEKAARLLTHTPHSIQEVGRLCGYSNHSAFSRAFQRRYQQAPRDYRQQQRAALHAPRGARPGGTTRIRRLRRRAAVVTRRYPDSTLGMPPPRWAEILKREGTLPPLPRGATPIALLHDATGDCRVPKLDLGVMVEPAAADSMAMPPSLRQVLLPDERCACLPLEHADQVESVLRELLYGTLPAFGEHYSGEAIRLVERGGGLELQLPLLDNAGRGLPTTAAP